MPQLGFVVQAACGHRRGEDTRRGQDLSVRLEFGLLRRQVRREILREDSRVRYV